MTRRDDVGAYDAALAVRRVEAVAAVVEAGSVQALADLVDGVSQPYLVGYALAGHSVDFDKAMIAWLAEGPHRQQAARGYLRARMRDGDAAVCDHLLTHIQEPAIKAEILWAMSDPQEAWEKLQGMHEEVTRNYWTGFTYYGLGAEFSRAEPDPHR